MARRSEHTQEQIREMVLNAAETIVVEEGFHALTVRKVALEIGYTVGSIYMVFANMDDVVMHVKGRALDELAGQLRQLEPCESAEQHILALAEVYLQFAHQHFNRWRMIFEAIKDAPVPEWYQQKTREMFSIVEQPFCRLLPDPADPEQAHLAAQALWSGVHGACVLSLNGSLGRVGAENAQATVAMLVTNFIAGWSQPRNPASATPPRK
ncbi:TetR/AcrR family transcriptional regulator [Methylomonas sp. SURF-2]|uniref:TetR/AcrR family transcriptional regulator n=1 Tax=Methylomonas subterranea TaxID=2952225 RepID=A0ABT1TLS9_9GAMM|nr:TetR/AcrR family transcriptional regulator [Methylomonas sp. SURF-2]MCQ8105724.1 TetR/AcrR family transcriptional regulator [Methylomonas sp. SURF-2]